MLLNRLKALLNKEEKAATAINSEAPTERISGTRNANNDPVVKVSERVASTSQKPLSRVFQYILPEGDFCAVDPLAIEILQSPKTIIVGPVDREIITDEVVKAIVCLNTPRTGSMVLLDTSGVHFNLYTRFPHVSFYAKETDKILLTLEQLCREVDRRLNSMAAKGIDHWDGEEVYVLINDYASLFKTDKQRFTKSINHLLLRMRETGFHLIAVAQDISDYHNIDRAFIETFSTQVATHISDYESKRLFDSADYAMLPKGKCAVNHWIATTTETYIRDIPEQSDVDLSWLRSYWLSEKCKKY